MKFTTFTLLVPLFFCATRIHLFPNNSIVSKVLLNIFELIRYSIISFILFCPLLLQHKVLSWNPLYFCSKLEHLGGQASVFLNHRKCCYILYIWSFLSAFTESLTIGMLNILDCYSNFSLFIICHLFLMLYIWNYLLQFISRTCTISLNSLKFLRTFLLLDWPYFSTFCTWFVSAIWIPKYTN